MSKSRAKILIAIIFLWTAILPAKAATVSHLVNFDLSATSTSGAVANDTLTLSPFDSDLGTLDEVRVSIDGDIVHTGTVFGIPYNVNVDLDLNGLGGRYFNFNGSGLEIIHSGNFGYASCTIAGCVPAPGPFLGQTTSFQFDFSFNRTFQELTGINQGFIDDFTVGGTGAVIPPLVINGAIPNFKESLIPLNLMELVMIRNVGGLFANLTTYVFGSMTITYDYTPNPIPLPAAFWLFGTALLGLVGYSKRRKVD